MNYPNANNTQVSNAALMPVDILDQRRSSGGDLITISVTHGESQIEVDVHAQSTFGDLKEVIAQKTGLEPCGQKILFRGQEKEDNEQLYTVGVKDKSKIILLEKPKAKETKIEQPVESEATRKALAMVAGVKSEVDMLSEKVAALEMAANQGNKVEVEKFDLHAELLMRLLLKLDSVEAEGEAKLQRKTEVLRIQHFHELLDNLKAKNSNPFSNFSKDVSVTTEWESFDSGEGSSNVPPPASSSAEATHPWNPFA